MNRRISSAVLVVLLSCPAAWARSRNVILMVGDGMGVPILGLGQSYNESVLKAPPLYFQQAMRSGQTGLVTTRSSGELVTDSAAAATAMATGVRTENDVVGMDDSGRPLTNIFEIAREKGLAVGVVTTDRLTGATPAAFTTHVPHRAQSGAIAAQQLAGRYDVLFGAGREDYDLAEAKRDGYWIMKTKKDLLAKSARNKPLWLGVFSSTETPYVASRPKDTPSLKEMSLAALQKLSASEKGFVLLIEGGRIDHAAHANLTRQAIEEFLEFDDTLGAVLAYLNEHSDTTLFITADHDTGGAGLTKTAQGEDYPGAEQFAAGKNVFWLSHFHTASPVLLVGVGPDGSGAAGWHDNTDLFTLTKNALGFE